VQPSDADEILLSAPDPVPAPPTVPPLTDAYRLICTGDEDVGASDFRLPKVTAPSAPVVPEDAVARPVDLEVVLRDSGDELLVADESLPMIHRFALAEDGTLTALEPIVTGVPVRDIVVTPEVPATPLGDGPLERFVYAIDANDGTVFAIDYTDPESESFGAVLPVHVGEGPSDRIPLLSRALSLEVLTPGFPGDLCTPDSVDGETGPRVLRGVFLAVGLSNGRVQIIDVHDLDATCRGAVRVMDGYTCSEAAQVSDLDQQVYIQRHRPRIGTFLTLGISVTATPQFEFEGSPGRLEDSGRPTSLTGPGLAPLTSCPSLTQRIFPVPEASEQTTPLICSVRDPWAAQAETWRATWYGTIPDTRGGLGRILSAGEASAQGEPSREGLLTFAASDARFCERGVLGRDDVMASGLSEIDPERFSRGDQVVIVSDPVRDAMGDVPDDCAVFVADEEGIRSEELSFVVAEAHARALVVEPGDADTQRLLTLCYPGELVGYEVRSREFTVVGSRAGFLHRVVATEEGCRVDVTGQPIDSDDPDTRRIGRAFDAQLFQNPFVAFQLDVDPASDDVLIPEVDAELSFGVGNVPGALLEDVGLRGTRGARTSAILEQLAFSPGDNRLYAVDSNSDGLAMIDVDPLARIRTFE